MEAPPGPGARGCVPDRRRGGGGGGVDGGHGGRTGPRPSRTAGRGSCPGWSLRDSACRSPAGWSLRDSACHRPRALFDITL